MLDHHEKKQFRRWLASASNHEVQGKYLELLVFRNTKVTENEVRLDINWFLKEIDDEMAARREVD